MSEVYSVVLPHAPYVIAAYGLLWAAFVVYVGLVFGRLNRLERQVETVEKSVSRRQAP